MKTPNKGSEEEQRIAELARRTQIPLGRLRRAALGQVTLSSEEYRKLLASKMLLPKGIKKPFGN